MAIAQSVKKPTALEDSIDPSQERIKDRRLRVRLNTLD
jgi:hypothetical protein